MSNPTMTSEKTFAILGSGMQGTAAAYDLAKFAGPARIRLGDTHLGQAELAVERVQRLTGHSGLTAHAVDALDEGSLRDFLAGVDVVLSCVPYYMHPRVARVAIACGVSMADLGGNTQVTHDTLALDELAKAAQVSLVPDCGLAPGLVNSLGLALLEMIPQPDSIRLICGVLPQHPVPPFNYKLTFNVEGLVTEYDYHAVVLRDGEIQHVDTLAEVEIIPDTPLGPLEAFTTSGGTSTAPYTFQGRVRNYEYKTFRFPGHAALMRIFKDFGFWNEEPVRLRTGQEVAPKDVFCAVFGEALKRYADEDQCVIRAEGFGKSDAGENMGISLEVWDKQDPATGFTAMERLTGFSLSIIAQRIAAGAVPWGAIRYELSHEGVWFVEELRRRGVQVSERRS